MTTESVRAAGRIPRWAWLCIALILAAGVFFRFYNLDRKVFWEDEVLGAIHTFGYTEAEIVAASPRLTAASDVKHYLEPDRSLGVTNTVSSLAAEDPQHAPPYYVISHLWAQQFGGSVEALRLPAAIFGVILLPCVFWLALELFGSLESAIVSVLLVAASPFFVLYSQEARETTMWATAIALDGVVFLRAIRAQTGAPLLWIVYGALTAAALYIYPLSLLVALGFAAYLLIRERARPTRAMLGCVLATIAALALFVPWAKIMMTSAGTQRGMAAIFTSKLPPAQIARIFARDIRLTFFDVGTLHLGPIGFTAVDAALTLIAVALCAYAIVALIRSTPYSVWGFVVIGLCLSMTPLLLRDLFAHGNFVYQERYFMPLLLGAQLAVAALFSRMLFGSAGRAARTAWTLVFASTIAGELLSCALASQAATWWNKDYERAPAVAAIVNASQQPLVVSDYFTPSILELSLYLDPATPMRLDLKCAQCDLPPHAGAALATTGYRNVFAVQASDAAGPAHDAWIDPAPFPPEIRPLNMFSNIPAGH